MLSATDAKEIFHERFNELASEKGFSSMTKADKAKVTGLSASGIAKIEGNGTKLPSVETLLKLSEYFGVSVSYLIGESDSKSLQMESDKAVFDKFDFTEEMVQTLQNIAAKPIGERNIYRQALRWLLGNKGDNNTDYPLLYSIGTYFNRIHTPGRKTVDTTDLENLKYAITLDNLKLEDLIATVEVMLLSENDFTSEEMDAYLLDNIMQELKSIRKDFVEQSELMFKLLNEKHHSPAKLKETLENVTEKMGDKEIEAKFYQYNQ